MKLGAHVSAAGSLTNAIYKAQEIGAECIQIFPTPPQSFLQKDRTEAEIAEFIKAREESKISPVFFHGTYLVNLATENPQNLKLSIDSLVFYQNLAARIGAAGTIFHIGSHKGKGFQQAQKQVISAIKEILDKSPKDVDLIIENAAGKQEEKGKIGENFSEIGQILKTVKAPNLKVCLDTCHAFVSGYEIHKKAGFEKALKEFDEKIGFENLVAIHANDSKAEFGSGLDRHENIGEGYIGKDGFRVILSEKTLSELPFVLEVPGFDNKGPDKQNLDILKSLVKSSK